MLDRHCWTGPSFKILILALTHVSISAIFSQRFLSICLNLLPLTIRLPGGFERRNRLCISMRKWFIWARVHSISYIAVGGSVSGQSVHYRLSKAVSGVSALDLPTGSQSSKMRSPNLKLWVTDPLTDWLTDPLTGVGARRRQLCNEKKWANTLSNHYWVVTCQIMCFSSTDQLTREKRVFSLCVCVEIKQYKYIRK